MEADSETIPVDVLAETVTNTGNFYIRLENEDELRIKSYVIRRYGDGGIEIVFSHLNNFDHEG